MSTTLTVKANGRNMSMNVTVSSPRFDKPAVKDYAIRHEHIQNKNISSPSSPRYLSPKRDPILQNNQEANQEFKCSVKTSPQSKRMTIFDDQPYQPMRSRGEFNQVDNPRGTSPRVEARKNFGSLRYEECSPEVNERRLRKGVKSPNRGLVDPLVGQDVYNEKLVKPKAPFTPSELLKRLNNRSRLQPCDGQPEITSPKGRVFKDSTIEIGQRNTSAITMNDQQPVVNRRLASPQFKKRDAVNGMKGLLEYQHAKSYREQPLSPKCSSVPFQDMIKTIEKNNMIYKN